MCSHAAPHALLIVDWGAQGAALLSVPTREYLQSSGWIEPTVVKPTWGNNNAASMLEPRSVASGSGFWADGHNSTESDWRISTGSGQDSSDPRHSAISDATDSDSGRASIETERGTEAHVDEVGAHEAFVAGMIFALSQTILPGGPYIWNAPGKTPSSKGTNGRWKLEECLR